MASPRALVGTQQRSCSASSRPLRSLCLSLAPSLLLALAFGAGCASQSGESTETVDSPEAARVFDQVITEAEIDRWMKDAWYAERTSDGHPAKVYEARMEALEGLVSERVLEGLANEEGISSADVLANRMRAMGGISEEEIVAFFDNNQASMPPGRGLVEMRGPIRSFLERALRERAMATLREDAPVLVLLSPPRAEVAATGPSLGPDVAPVTIIEFSDYECPYCRRAEPIVAALLEKYGDSLRFVYRHLPLDFHPNARPAALAAMCAEEQGRFWDYHARLFEDQSGLTAEDLTAHATALELDVVAFAACQQSDETGARLDEDIAAANGAGASGTPAFFVNGILMSGAQPVEAFSAVIDRELARAAAQTP